MIKLLVCGLQKVSVILEGTRKTVRFVLAAFLWSHALFFLNFHSALVSSLVRLLHLTLSEVILFILLSIFTFLVGSGLWRTIVNLTYIYFFPFVLLFYLSYGLFKILLVLGRWLNPPARAEAIEVEQQGKAAPQTLAVQSSAQELKMGFKAQSVRVVAVLSRPFKKFTLLWCLLLIFATHISIVWVSLIVVLTHLALIVVRALKVTLVSGTWLPRIAEAIRAHVEDIFSKLASVTRESAPTKDLESLWNSLRGFDMAARFLRNRPLISRWMWLCGAVLLTSGYLYLAFLFSFAYYGISRVGGIPYSWPEALVTSIFIPFYVKELPKMLTIRVLGGLHCVLVVSIGVGTVINYLRRRFEPIRNVAIALNARLEEQMIREKYSILEDRFAGSATAKSASTDSPKH